LRAARPEGGGSRRPPPAAGRAPKPAPDPIYTPGRPASGADHERRSTMDFQPSERCADFQARLGAFLDEHVYPAEGVYERQLRDSGDPHHQPAVMEELKTRAREAGLWNMFLPDAT